jgi:hypothetical protein
MWFLRILNDGGRITGSPLYGAMKGVVKQKRG